MHIAVNLRLFIEGEIGGLENYVRHVVRGLADEQRRRGQPLTVFARRSELENVRAFAPDARLVTLPHEVAEACSAAELATGDYDLLFCPLLVLEPIASPIPSAVMVPDLQHEYFPEFFSEEILEWRRERYGPTLEKADAIFTLSEDAKRSIVECFEVSPDKVVVVHLDVDPEFREPGSADARKAFDELELPSEYLYYPANFWPHKNHEILIEALALLRATQPDLHLVLTGAASTGEDRVRARVADLGLESRVRFLGYQDRHLLPEIYRHATAAVLPSLFEGFGIPILEAFHCGTPVVASRSGSCPEVAGDGALLVDASDAEDLAAGIRRVLSDDELRSSIVEKGRARASEFSWQSAVDLTLRTFDRIVPERAARELIVEDRPLVTVVTPSFNMARFIGETIESVLSQDYPHIDYLVMDGGSSDDTVEILRRYEGRLRYVSQPDGGQGDAVNKGFLRSRGRIFTFLNADDTYLPGAVGRAVEALVAEPSASVVYGEGLHVYENGEVMERYPTKEFSPDTLMRNCYICQPTSFMWADVFESAGMLNTQVTALDYDLWIRLARGGHHFIKIDEVLATSRMYGSNKTLGDRGAVYRDIIGIVKRHYGYVPYDWLFGYACYLVDRRDQVFEQTYSSRTKVLVGLLLGLRYNPLHFGRYLREWMSNVGLGLNHAGRWEDGWISRHYAQQHEIGPECERVRIEGRNVAPDPNLELTVRLGGDFLGRQRLDSSGPFVLDYPCPGRMRGGLRLLEIVASKTFQPRVDGDMRHLSCVIDSIETISKGDG